MATTTYGQFLTKAGIGTGNLPGTGQLYTTPTRSVTTPVKQSASAQANTTYNAASGSNGGGGNLNVPTPPAPQLDYSPFDNLISSIDQLGNTLTLGEQNAETAINQNTTAALTDLEGQKQSGEANLNTYKQQAATDAEGNINQQRRMQSEIQQGIQAAYGGTTGTGAFIAEQAGNTTLNNIAKYKTALQGEYSKVANMQNELLRTYISEKTRLENDRSQKLAEAKQKLQETLAGLQMQKGQVGIARSQYATDVISRYQSEVNAINMNNVQYQRDLEARAHEIQNQLQARTYSMTYQSQQRLLNFYEDALQNGNLTPQGIKEAESAIGVGGGSLKLKDDSGSSGLIIDPKTGKLTVAQ